VLVISPPDSIPTRARTCWNTARCEYEYRDAEYEHRCAEYEYRCAEHEYR
jgi:hypothetical protein